MGNIAFKEMSSLKAIFLIWKISLIHFLRLNGLHSDMFERNRIIRMKMEIQRLSFKYRKNSQNTISDINLSIPEGIFGLIGENGAGKTTLLKSIATLLPVKEGMIDVNGFVLPGKEKDIRNILGYLPQDFEMFPNLTVFEMLDYIAMLKNIGNQQQRNNEIVKLLDKFQLGEKQNCKIKTLSGGMKQRIGIVQALLGDPKLIILDEPTVGLDPKERIRFRNVLNTISGNKIIIISTHIIGEVAMMCSNVAVMKEGKIIFCGSIDDLTKQAKGKVYVATIDISEEIDNLYHERIIAINRRKNKLEIRFLSETVLENYIQVKEPTLEDAYFYITSYMKG